MNPMFSEAGPGREEQKELMRGYLQAIHHQLIIASGGQLGKASLEQCRGVLRRSMPQGHGGSRKPWLN